MVPKDIDNSSDGAQLMGRVLFEARFKQEYGSLLLKTGGCCHTEYPYAGVVRPSRVQKKEEIEFNCKPQVLDRWVRDRKLTHDTLE